jgi:hypothetical protein
MAMQKKWMSCRCWHTYRYVLSKECQCVAKKPNKTMPCAYMVMHHICLLLVIILTSICIMVFFPEIMFLPCCPCFGLISSNFTMLFCGQCFCHYIHYQDLFKGVPHFPIVEFSKWSTLLMVKVFTNFIFIICFSWIFCCCHWYNMVCIVNEKYVDT